jgi:hypothetical protein
MPRTFSYTTEVFDEYTDFPQTGDVDTIYIDASKNKAYRYDQSYYPISSEGVDIWGAIGSLSKGGGGGGGGASWGSINGTLSNQTDLNTALSAKQDTLTLTTTGTSGAATLVDSTLNIPQYGGGGGALKFSSLQVVNGTSVTNSTTQTITYSVLVPANTFTSEAFFDVTTRFTKTGSLSSWSARIYKNTSNTLTGATLIATLGNPFTASNTYTQNARFFRVSSSIIRYYQANFAGITDNISNNVNEGSTTFDLSVDNYFLVTIQLGTIVTDTIRGVMFKVLGYE